MSDDPTTDQPQQAGDAPRAPGGSYEAAAPRLHRPTAPAEPAKADTPTRFRDWASI